MACILVCVLYVYVQDRLPVLEVTGSVVVLASLVLRNGLAVLVSVGKYSELQEPSPDCH